jgi:hypothetical protein
MIEPMRVLIDVTFLLELLLNRKKLLTPSQKEKLFWILESLEIEAYMLAKDIDYYISESISALAGSKTAIEKISSFKEFINPVASDCKRTWEQVRHLSWLDIDAALLVACAEAEGIHAILTHRPEKFSGAETRVSIWTFEMLHTRTRFERTYEQEESVAKLLPEYTPQYEDSQLIAASSLISLRIQFLQKKLVNELEQEGMLLERSSLAEGWAKIKTLEEEATSLFYSEDYKGAQLKYVQILAKNPSLVYIMVRILDCYRKQFVKYPSEQLFDDIQQIGNYVLSICVKVHHRKRVHQFLGSTFAKYAISMADKTVVEYAISHFNEAYLLSSDEESNSALDVVSNWNIIDLLLTFRRKNLYSGSELLKIEHSLKDRYLNRATITFSRLKKNIRKSLSEPSSVFLQYRQELTEDAKKHFRGFEDSFWERILEENDNNWLWERLIDE